MSVPRVAVTGMGLVTALGRRTDLALQALVSARPAITDAGAGLPGFLRLAGQVAPADLQLDLKPGLARELRLLNRGGHLALAAALDATGQAALPERAGGRGVLYLATGDLTQVGYEFLYPATSAATSQFTAAPDVARLNQAAAGLEPFYLLRSLANNPYSLLAASTGFDGGGTSLGCHSPSGAEALELGVRAVRSGRAREALVVASGSWLVPAARLEMATLGLLSAGRNGVGSYRPFHALRDGFVPGEGGAALVLEDEEGARHRGARILAFVEGVGSACEARSALAVPEAVTAPALRSALAEAGITASELAFACPHGSGTRRGDAAEAAALMEVLGNAVPVCALKPYTGHMGAASDLAEVVLSVLAAAAGVVPATPGAGPGEPLLDALSLSPAPRRCTGARVLVSSYGAGAQSSAAVVAVAS